MPKGLGGLINNATRTARELGNAATAAKRAGETIKDMVDKKKVDGKAAGKTDSKAKDVASWACTCGTSNTGKFCGECGKAQGTETVCSCGWKRPPESGMKFCGECGTKFEA